MTTVKDINTLFRQYGRTLGCVESFTGGLFAKDITSVSGASHFFKGGIISYANETKARIVGVSYNTIDKFGVVSQEVASEMAGHGKALLNVDYCISFTGNAGPEALEGKKVGEIYIGVACNEICRVYQFFLNGNREEICSQAVAIGLNLIKEALLERK